MGLGQTQKRDILFLWTYGICLFYHSMTVPHIQNSLTTIADVLSIICMEDRTAKDCMKNMDKKGY